MADTDEVTRRLPADLAVIVRRAVDEGEYPTADHLVEEALRDWLYRRQGAGDAARALKADIDAGLADIAAGRVGEFDLDEILRLGRERSGLSLRSG